MDVSIIKVNGPDLTDSELTQINAAVFREWKVAPYSKEKLLDTLFFFLKSDNKILSMAGLKKVEPVFLNEEKFSVLGVVEVVANTKGKGYGKSVVSAIRDYLTEIDTTGIGFTMPKNTPFYEKCGFKIELNSTKRFVYMKDGERIINQDGQVIFYQNSSDDFMVKVLAEKELEVSIPTDGLW